MVLHGAPALARPERAIDRPGEGDGPPIRLFGAYGDLMPAGYGGVPSRGTAEEGRAIVDALAALVVPFLRELDAHDWRPGPWIIR